MRDIMIHLVFYGNLRFQCFSKNKFDNTIGKLSTTSNIFDEFSILGRAEI